MIVLLIKLKKLKKVANYDINVVAMVVSEESDIAENYLTLGFDDYIVKPLNKEIINDLLKKLKVK